MWMSSKSWLEKKWNLKETRFELVIEFISCDYKAGRDTEASRIEEEIFC